MAWYNNDWQYRIKITSDNTQVSASVKGLTYDLSNIVDATFWSNVKSDGSDIRITQSDEVTEVARDVINLDNVSETGQVRFDTSNISTTVNEDYYIYFGNAAATEPTPSSTYGQYNAYDTNTTLYYPFDEGTGTVAGDRTSNINDGTINGATWTTGVINDALAYDGINDYVNTPNITPGTNFSYSKLFNYNGDGFLNGQGYNPSEGGRSALRVLSNQLQFSQNPVGIIITSSNTLTPNTWYNVIISYDNGTVDMFVDGVNVGSASGFSTIASDPFILGALAETSNYYDGEIDELAIYSKSLVLNDSITISNNELNNSSFWTTSATEENTQTLSIDLLTINDTFNNVSIINNFNLGVDTLTINDLFQDVTFFNQYNLSLDIGTITNNFQNITFSTGQDLVLDLLELTDNLQNIDFVNKRTLNLEFETITNNFQDITLNVDYTLDVDLLEINYNFQDIHFSVFAVELILDAGNLLYNFEDISFKVNFSQDVFNELTQAKEDIVGIFNEAGETVFYQVNTQTYNRGGQLKSIETNQYPIKVMWQQGTNYKNEIKNIGEYASGNKKVKLLPLYQITEGIIITPTLNDYIVTEEGTRWEIINIEDVRMWGGVLELFCEVVKRDNDWNTN